MKFKKYLIKTLTVIAGSIISAYGITLAIGAGFGGATLAILWQGLTNVTGMTIGTSSLVVAVAMIIFALFYDKKQINVGTILYQIIYSFFVDVFTKIQHYTDIKAVNFIIMLLRNHNFFIRNRALLPPQILAEALMRRSHFRLQKKTVGKLKLCEWYLIF